MRRIIPNLLIPSLLILSLILIGPSPGLADPPSVDRLDNGLGIVVQRLDRAPVVAIQVWVKAGSRLETPAEKGLTHQIEHMIFKGTPTRGLGQVAGQIENSGGRINAYTTFDHTVYHVVLPADKWEQGLEVLADAVQNSLFDAEELKKEKEVVLEEWRRGRDSPRRRLAEEVLALAFQDAPYRYPIIGFEETIRNFERRQILDYMAKWYTPDRVNVVLVGDIPVDKVRAKAKALFADYNPGPPVRTDLPRERPQDGFRFKAIHEKVKQAYFAFAFQAHGLNDPRTPAADLLSELLGGGQAARLTAELWGKKGLVNSIHASSFTPLDEGLMWISGTTDPAKLNEALNAVWAELLASTAEPFTPAELDRAKLAFKASFVRDKETMDGQASKLGFFQTMTGGLDQESVYLREIESLSLEAIRKRAAKLFSLNNLSLVVMLPEGAGLPSESLIKDILTNVKRPDRTAAVSPTNQSGARIEAARQKPLKSDSKVRIMPLPAGAKLLVQEDHSLPLFAIQAYLLGGVRLEPAAQAGIYKLMAGTWTRGAAGIPADKLASRIEDLAGRISAESGRNTFGLSGEFLSQTFDQGLDLFAKILLEPTFDDQEIVRRKADLLAAIKAKEERPASIAFRTFSQNVHLGHPYARDTLGTAETIKNLTAAQVRALHQKMVRGENLVIAVVGDVRAEVVHQRLTELLAPLKAKAEIVPPGPPEDLPENGLTASEVRPAQAQVHTLFGFRAPSMKDPDTYALDLLADALANQSGRLFMELRDQKSLAYALTAFNSPGMDSGSFGFYIGHAPAKEARVKAELRAQLAKILKEPLSDEEFAGARARLLASWIIDRQSMAKRAADLALYDRMGLGWDYPQKAAREIKNLTPAKVLEAAKRHLDTTKTVWVRVGPQPVED